MNIPICSGNSSELVTPILVKTEDGAASPAGVDAYYLLTGNGLFLNRDNPVFRSSVAVRKWPSEWAPHAARLEIKLPPVPQILLERIIGFFDIVGRRHGAEALVLLVWAEARGYEVVVPPQVSVVGGIEDPYPIKLDYEMPVLSPDVRLVGDIHSHVNMEAYTSRLDHDDFQHFAGLHLVAGRLFDGREPPEFEAVFAVDGYPFRIYDPFEVLEAYHQRRVKEVPPAWLEQITVLDWNEYAGNTAPSVRYPGPDVSPSPLKYRHRK